MATQSIWDAVVVGAGPNGLAAAITMARAGRRVLLVEGREQVGGAASSAELTLPGFVHDLGSAIHPLGVGSPFLRELPLERYGLRWVYSPAPLAHPLDDAPAAVLERSVGATGRTLGRDATTYARLMAPIVRGWERIAPAVLGPLRLPRHPLALGRFGLRAIWPARLLAAIFRGDPARALLAGLAGHSALPLEQAVSAAVALVLGGLGHAVGWPMPQGGAQRLADTLAAYLRDLGGTIRTGVMVRDLGELPAARAVLLDVTPRQLVSLAGDRLPPGYRRALERYRYGVGVFKLDWALDGPIPWRDPACARAGTVHLGGTLEEVAASERAIWRGEHPQRPYVLLAQPSRFDPTRAPRGRHTVWAYCHVPNGSSVDMTGPIEEQIERFAPGFRARVIGRSAMGPATLERFDPNLVGGDIGGGVQDLRQLFTRPVARLTPYATPVRGLYLCSSSTPPGGGVHGMCGYHAALRVLSVEF